MDEDYIDDEDEYYVVRDDDPDDPDDPDEQNEQEQLNDPYVPDEPDDPDEQEEPDGPYEPLESYAPYNTEHSEHDEMIKKYETPTPEQEHAATKIQRTWRRHIDMQVFKYYRELINFKNRADPAKMLKYINPAEARMLDVAAGIHIKFRLGGDNFPPNVYYKIFTHAPIQDLCANAPRDYTNPVNKRRRALVVNNKVTIAAHFVNDKVGWYERSENNGWRLVTDRGFLSVVPDGVVERTAAKQAPFHHNRMQRKADVVRRRKQRKMEWYRKTYMPSSKDGVPQSAMNVDDDDEGTLVDWIESLDFDKYMEDWNELGTSWYTRPTGHIS